MKKLIYLVLTVLIVACSSDSSNENDNNNPSDLVGTWDKESKTLTLDEDFVFNDGENSQRKWVITKVGDKQYTGKAGDVIGEATGISHGNAFQWKYLLNVPYKGSTIDLDIDDWLYLNEDNVLINRSVMYKYGFKVGEIVISFNKK